MKKLFSLMFLLALSASVFAQTTPRFGTSAGRDNTGRVITYSYTTPAYADTVELATKHYESVVKVAALTGDAVVVASTTNAKVGDKIYMIFNATGGARTVTFSTGMVPSATLVVDSAQKATASFIFDGTSFIEASRAKQ